MKTIPDLIFLVVINSFCFGQEVNNREKNLDDGIDQETDFGELYQQNKVNSFGILIDQDLFTPLNEDRDYTMGINLSWSSSSLNNNCFFRSLQCLGVNQKRFNRKNGWEHTSMPSQISLYGCGYTPDSLQTASIVFGDRPYASIIALNFESSFAYRYSRDGKTVFVTKRYSYSVGMLGLSFQGQLQDFIHKVVNPCYADSVNCGPPLKPLGWHHQISHGGELTGLFTGNTTFLLTRAFMDEYSNYNVNRRGFSDSGRKLSFFERFFEASAGYGYMLGYYNNLSAHFQFRFGAINPAMWLNNYKSNDIHIKDFDRNPGGNLVKKDRDVVFAVRSRELFLFGNITANAMIYNVLLHGQFRDSNYSLGYYEAKHFFGEAMIGLAYTSPAFSLRLIPMSIRTGEINTTYNRWHYWAGVNLLFHFKD